MNETKINNEFESRRNKTTKEDLKKALDNEEKILKKSQNKAVKKFIEDIQLMFSLIKDYWSGDYKDISWGTIAGIVAALIYVLSPIDLIPDFLPGIGMLDDAAVIALCLKLVYDDLEKYKTFKEYEMQNIEIVEEI